MMMSRATARRASKHLGRPPGHGAQPCSAGSIVLCDDLAKTRNINIDQHNRNVSEQSPRLKCSESRHSRKTLFNAR
jgi:hypothetical protein